MIVVIADDITGAAEIAGIAHRYNLKSQLSFHGNMPMKDSCDVFVIATDARSYDATTAAKMTKYALSALTLKDLTPNASSSKSPYILFRKTDSALRGNVKEELEALGGNFIYMPANPSKGRVIKDGIYLINGTPISETDFRYDPEFPAWSSKIEERFPDIDYANAETHADVTEVVKRAKIEGKRLAGAADLFEALLHDVYPDICSRKNAQHKLSDETIIVCGSTQSKALQLDMPVETMPLDVFYENARPVTWAASIINRYMRYKSVILTIGDKEIRQDKDAAVYLRHAMAEVTCALISAHEPRHLIIEGGATAFAILSQLPHYNFEITEEIAPGIVSMCPLGSKMTITMKPGSYSWGKLF